LITQLCDARLHFYGVLTRQEESLEERFRRLVQDWRADVGPSSSPTEMAIHPAYQRITGMGPAAVPLLLAELEHEPDHWFWALKAITGVDPVDPAQRGILTEMAKAWLAWGRTRGVYV
jgi:hypothetical protein